jgi:hypothetical protein
MKSLDDPPPRKDEQPPEPSHLEEAYRIIEDYTRDLRDIVKKMLRRLN